MKSPLRHVLVLLASCAITLPAAAHPTYIGYSGAPGSSGRCASSCHGASGGTIQADGFPAEYLPDQQYTITVSHSGGAAIKQFNGSCRLGSGSQNAGVIAVGTNTLTYSASGETNGVHLSTTDLESGTFLWTAPSAGSGPVTLYIAGHQGAFAGTNTTLSLTATELTTGVPRGRAASSGPLRLDGNVPNPVRARTSIRFALQEAATVTIDIFDPEGRLVESYRNELSSGSHELSWNASGRSSGVYYYRVRTGNDAETRSMLVIR
jgi:hypothetical protein